MKSNKYFRLALGLIIFGLAAGGTVLGLRLVMNQPIKVATTTMTRSNSTEPSSIAFSPSSLIAPSATTSSAQSSPLTTPTSVDEPPLLLKTIGLNLDYYDPATNRAGDLEFTKVKLQFGVIFSDFGFVIPGTQSATGNDKANPQPTFIAPLGTKVHSLVDGVVIEVPKLYSDDFSILVGTTPSSPWRYETEHVINPLVKAGDLVTAGQIIAEVSPHNTAPAGFGIVEIGILHGGNPPQHVCPFQYLDSSIKADIQAKLKAFYQTWADYRDDSKLYNESNLAIPGCLTTKPING